MWDMSTNFIFDFRNHILSLNLVKIWSESNKRSFSQMHSSPYYILREHDVWPCGKSESYYYELHGSASQCLPLAVKRVPWMFKATSGNNLYLAFWNISVPLNVMFLYISWMPAGPKINVHEPYVSSSPVDAQGTIHKLWPQFMAHSWKN